MDWQIVNALVKVVEVKDQVTAAHTWRVALYVQALAEAYGLDPGTVRRLMNAAVLHDIGKIDIPHEILAKPSRLTDEEFALIQTHTILGYDRLQRMGVTDPLILALVRSHHERLDGSGYPDGLVGDAIPQAARSFAVIDSFDAMTSLRPYRDATGRDAADRAIAELKLRAGEWYCPRSVELFSGLYDAGALDWIRAHFNDRASIDELASGPDPDEIEEARRRLVDAEAATANDTPTAKRAGG